MAKRKWRITLEVDPDKIFEALEALGIMNADIECPDIMIDIKGEEEGSVSYSPAVMYDSNREGHPAQIDECFALTEKDIKDRFAEFFFVAAREV